MKKLLKSIFAILFAVLVVAGIAVGVLAVRPQLQMKLVTDYTFKNISAYNWQQLTGTDPVEAALKEALGEEKTQSRSLIYDFLKSKASEMTWEMSYASPEEMRAELTVTYIDGRTVLEAYADELAAYICRGIIDGSLTLENMSGLVNTVSDEENAAMLKAAVKKPLSDTATAVVNVEFEKKYGIFYLTSSISDELNDVVSCGLLSELYELPEMVIDRVIPGLIYEVFSDIQSSDYDDLARLSGLELKNYITLDGYNSLSNAIQTFISERTAAMEFTVGKYDRETGTISVDCTYCDGSGVVSEFMGAVTRYAFTNLFSNPVPDDATMAQLFTNSARSISDYPRLQKTLIFRIDTETGEIGVPSAVSEVVTANLSATISKLAALMGGLN